MRNAAPAEKGIKRSDTLQPLKNNSNESDCSPYILVNGDLRRIFKDFINGHVKIHLKSIQIADRRCVSGTTLVGPLPIRQLPDTCHQYCNFFQGVFLSRLIIQGLLSSVWWVVNGYHVFIYWAKVLPEQLELLQIFRKHEIFRKFLRMHFEQAIILLSKSLNLIVINCLQITSFDNVLE